MLKRASVLIGIATVVVIVVLALLPEPATQESNYRFETADQGALTTVVTASGTIAPITSVEVSSQLSGQISELFVDFNDKVAKGQPLARLDPRTFKAKVRESEAELLIARSEAQTQKAAVARAQAELLRSRAEARVAKEATASERALTEVARLQLERKRKLLDRKIVAGSDTQEAQATHQSKQAQLRAAKAEEAVRQASIGTALTALRMEQTKLANAEAAIRLMEAKVATAQIELDRTVIRSPINGIVVKRNVKLGQTVAASLRAPKLFTIAEDLRRMEVETSVDEADIGRIKQGQSAEFTVDAYVGQFFTGRIDEIRKSPEVFQNVVTYTVVIAADNANLALYPGMTASVKIIVGEVKDALRVPNAALRYTPKRRALEGMEPLAPGKGRIWVLSAAGSAIPVTLDIGITDSVRTEIRGTSLQRGHKVIVGETPQLDSGILPRLKSVIEGTALFEDLKAVLRR